MSRRLLRKMWFGMLYAPSLFPPWSALLLRRWIELVCMAPF